MKKISILTVTGPLKTALAVLALSIIFAGCGDPADNNPPAPPPPTPTEGTADTTLAAPPEFGVADAWLIAGGSGAVTLSKSGANSVPSIKEFRVDNSAAPAGASYSWRFDGQEIGNEASVTLEAGSLETGGHSLSLEISAEGRTWSNRIRVTINE